MPTIVDILTFMSMINSTSERLKARNFFICRYFSFYEQLKFWAQLSWAWKKFYNLGPDLDFETQYPLRNTQSTAVKISKIFDVLVIIICGRIHIIGWIVSFRIV